MNATPVEPVEQIHAKRAEIDEIDRHIAELICKRFGLVKEIGAIKQEHHLAVHDPTRESQQMSVLSGIARQHNVPQSVIVFPFKMMMIMSRQAQGEKHAERITRRFCWSCEWRTCGLDDPNGSGFRICPRCNMPLL